MSLALDFSPSETKTGFSKVWEYFYTSTNSTYHRYRLLTIDYDSDRLFGGAGMSITSGTGVITHRCWGNTYALALPFSACHSWSLPRRWVILHYEIVKIKVLDWKLLKAIFSCMSNLILAQTLSYPTNFTYFEKKSCVWTIIQGYFILHVNSSKWMNLS